MSEEKIDRSLRLTILTLRTGFAAKAASMMSMMVWFDGGMLCVRV